MPGGGGVGQQDLDRWLALAQRSDQRACGAGLAQRHRVDPQSPRFGRAGKEAQPLAERMPVASLLCAAPPQPQQVERRQQPQRGRVEGQREALRHQPPLRASSCAAFSRRMTGSFSSRLIGFHCLTWRSISVCSLAAVAASPVARAQIENSACASKLPKRRTASSKLSRASALREVPA
mmetsp:Transcript_10442/g.42604  ORF Transcript_10442/g.42604 Transcript_10442/m.42604 type:complete len:178 (+) Transcript_10442:278-811(+)